MISPCSTPITARGIGGSFSSAEMRAGAFVIVHVGVEDPAQSPRVEDDDVIQTLAAD